MSDENGAVGRLRQLEGEIRVLLSEISGVVGAPPAPDEYVSNLGRGPKNPGPGSLPGWTWRPTDGWSVQVATEGAERNCLYVHTPSCSWPSDVVPLWPEDARSLAASLLVAADAVDASHHLPMLHVGRDAPPQADTAPRSPQ